MESYLILSGIGSSIPFGPWNMGVVWVVFRGWGISFRDCDLRDRPLRVINSLGPVRPAGDRDHRDQRDRRA